MNATRKKLGQDPWYFIEITDIERVKNLLTEAIQKLAAEVDDSAALHDLMMAQMSSLNNIWDNEEDDIWNAL